jgi:hypothetical protein
MTTATATKSNSTDETPRATAKITEAAAPYVERARGFAKERPWAVAALAGVLGIATLNTLRGRKA